MQQVAVRDELMRHIQRRQLVDRLAGARARREAALRLTANRLHEQRVVRAGSVGPLRELVVDAAT